MKNKKSKYVVTVTREELLEELDDLAREHLGVDRDKARRMLEEGRLHGTALEIEFKLRLFLLGE